MAMRLKSSLLGLCIVFFGFRPGFTEAVVFSIDQASPAIDGTITPDDVLVSGPNVSVAGSSLGLRDNFSSGDFDNLNVLSYGNNPIANPLFFSVDRVAVGLPGSSVNVEAQPGKEEAAGDVFRSLPPLNSNSVFVDEQTLGLSPGFFGDDLDALELNSQTQRVYFSIDQLSSSNSFGAGSLANDVFLNDLTGVFASGETHIGLLESDDIDALALYDVFEPGILNPGIDKALFSLSTFSPSTFTYSGTSYVPGVIGSLSPADVLLTDFTGGFSLWAAAGEIGLRSDDEVDALSTRAVPTPATLALLSFGLVGIGYQRRKQIKAA